MSERAIKTCDPSLRAQILAAAFEALDTDGPGRLTVRATARRLDIGMPAATRCFESRERLLTDMAAAALHDLAGAIEAALAAAPASRLARLRAAGAATQAYAERAPQRYALCWRIKDIDAQDENWLKASEGLCARLREVMDMGDPSPLTSHLAAGSLLHGYVQLRKSGALGPA